MKARRGLAAAVALAWAAVAGAHAATDAVAAEGGGGRQAVAAPPRSILLLPLHASEPPAHLDAMLACTFGAHAPSIAALPYDVRVVLAGPQPASPTLTARLDGLAAAVERSVRPHAPHASISSTYLHLTNDAYDKDSARGSDSSYAGPNAMFYDVMLGRGGGGGAGSTADAPAAAPDAPAPLLPPEDGAATTPPPHPYSFAVVLETDVCALRTGWLDIVLAPLLRRPAVLVSGSAAKVVCAADPLAPTLPCAGPEAWPRHARAHINGGAAAYRLTADATTLVSAARDQFGDGTPYDVALYLVARALGLAGSALFDHPRLVNVAAPVDRAHFNDTAYYGFNARAALVHAPRRLRVDGAAAVAARLGRPATVVVVPDVPALPTLLTGARLSLVQGGAARGGLAFIALSRAGFEEASALAPQRVVAAFGGGDSSGASAAASTFRALAGLSRHGMRSALVVGLDTAAVRLYTPAVKVLAAAAAGAAPRNASVLFQARWDADPLPAASPVPDVGAMLLAVSDASAAGVLAAGLDAWADAVGLGGANPPPPASILAAHNVSTSSTLPPDLFPRASSFFGPAWPRGARAKAPLLVSSLASGSPAPAWTAAAVRALRQARLWHAGPDAACATYTALGRAPLRMGDVESVHTALRRVSAFLTFIRTKKVDCAVLPGFLLGDDGPSAPFVPWHVVLDSEAVSRLSGGQTVFYGHARDVGAPADGLVWFDENSGRGRRDAHPPHTTPPSSLCHAHFRLPSGTSCFVAGLAEALDAAVAALVPSRTPPVCVTDSRRTSLAEAAVLGLEGRLQGVGSWMAGAAGGRPAFLTGHTWRAVGRRLGGNTTTTTSSLADLPHLLAPPPALHDAILAAFAPDAPGSVAWAGWAPLVDAAVCQAAAAAGAPPPLDLAAALPADRPTTLALLARTAAHIPSPVLDDDLTALTAWLRRPDRPGLRGGRTARLVRRAVTTTTADRPSVSAHMDAIHVLALATAAGADRAVLPAAPPLPDGQPRSWAQAVGEPAAAAMYGAFPAALPPSVGLLLDPAAALDAPSPLLPLVPRPNLASVALLDEPRHARAVAALLRATVGPNPCARFALNATAGALTRADDFLPRGRGLERAATPVKMTFDVTGLDPGSTHGAGTGKVYAAWLGALGAGSGGPGGQSAA